MNLAAPPRPRIAANRNEAPLPAPDHVLEALRALDGNDLRRYPVAVAREFERALAARLAVEPEALVVGSGADDLLLALARAFLQRGDDVLTVTPTFEMYARTAKLAGAGTLAVPYAKRWSLDPAAFARRAGPRTRLAIVGNPNNPTGDALTPEALVALARALPDVTLVVDEVYLTLSANSLLPLARTLPNVVVLGSLSKAAALAGLRVGYAVAGEPVAAALRAASAPFPVSVPSLIAATAYVNGGAATAAFERRLQDQVERSLDAMVRALRPFARTVARGVANFALFEFGPNADTLTRRLAEEGIDVRRLPDPSLDGAIRINALDDRETRCLIEAATKILEAGPAAPNLPAAASQNENKNA